MTGLAVPVILREGYIIGTKYNSIAFWSRNIVYKIVNNKIYIALLRDYVESMIMPGDSFSCKYNCEYFEYLFQGTVIEIHSGNPGYVVVEVNKCEEIVNTRQYTRYDVHLCSELKSVWDDASRFAIVINISQGGMAFISNQHLDYGEEMNISVFLNNGKVLNVNGKVIRRCAKTNSYEYSTQFTEVDDANNDILVQFLSEIDEQEREMISKYEKKVKGKL